MSSTIGLAQYNSAVTHNVNVNVIALLQSLNKGYGVSKQQLLTHLSANKLTNVEVGINNMVRDNIIVAYDNPAVPVQSVDSSAHQFLSQAATKSSKSNLPALLKLVVKKTKSKAGRSISLSTLWTKANYCLLSDYLEELTALDAAGLICFNPLLQLVNLTSLGSRLYHKSNESFLASNPSQTYYNKLDMQAVTLRVLTTLVTGRLSITVGELQQAVTCSLHPSLLPSTSSYSQLTAIIKSIVKVAINTGHIMSSESKLSIFTNLSLRRDRNCDDGSLIIIQCLHQNAAYSNTSNYSASNYKATSYTAVINAITSVTGNSDNDSILRQLQCLFQLSLLQTVCGRLVTSTAVNNGVVAQTAVTNNLEDVVVPPGSNLYCDSDLPCGTTTETYNEMHFIENEIGVNPFGHYTLLINRCTISTGNTFKIYATHGAARYTCEIQYYDYDGITGHIIKNIHPRAPIPEGSAMYTLDNYMGRTLLPVTNGDKYGVYKTPYVFDELFDSLIRDYHVLNFHTYFFDQSNGSYGTYSISTEYLFARWLFNVSFKYLVEPGTLIKFQLTTSDWTTGYYTNKPTDAIYYHDDRPPFSAVDLPCQQGTQIFFTDIVITCPEVYPELSNDISLAVAFGESDSDLTVTNIYQLPTEAITLLQSGASFRHDIRTTPISMIVPRTTVMNFALRSTNPANIHTLYQALIGVSTIFHYHN